MVELFFNKELSDVTFDVEALDEWKAIANELGFEAQLSLTKGKETPIPYPFMNEVMKRVYETLCPMKVEFKTYKKSTIPLEIMKQIAFSVRDKHFQKIEIWYDDKTPDPIVVGEHGYFYFRTKEGYNVLRDANNKEIHFSTLDEAVQFLKDNDLESTCRTEYTAEELFIIGRWGDELLDFPSLKKRAIEVFIENEAGELKKDIMTKTEKLKLITENTTSYMNGNMQRYEVVGSRW